LYLCTVIQHFLDYIGIERKYSPRTVEAYRDDLRDFCTYLSVATGCDWSEPTDGQICQLGEDDVKGWLLDLLENQKQSPRSVKRKLSALRSFYKWALRLNKVPRDITARIIPPKADKPLPVFFRPAEMQRAETNLATEMSQDEGGTDFDTLRDYLIIEVLYQTGMRQAELLGLQDRDWNLTEGQVRIFGKRRKERIVPVGAGLVKQVREYMEVRNRELPESRNINSFFVRKTSKGEVQPLSKNTLYSIVRTRMGEVSTLKKHSPHVLRHTFATAMLDNGADIRTIQELLGHASLSTTQVYTHTTFEQIKRVYMASHPRAKGGEKSENSSK